MAALLPSLCIFALAGGCAWSFLTARLFSHRSCQPFWGPSEMAVWRGPHLAPKLCQANSKIWFFHEGWAGVWSPPGWRVTGMCFLRLVERTGAASTGVPAVGSGAAGCASPSTAMPWGWGSIRRLNALQRPSPRRGCAIPFSANHLLAVPLCWLPVGLVRPGCWGRDSSASTVTLCPRFAPAQPPWLPAPRAVVSQAPAPAGGCWAGISAEVT